MSDKVDKTAGHLRNLIEKVRVYDKGFRDGTPIGNEHTDMLQAADEAETYLNRPAE